MLYILFIRVLFYLHYCILTIIVILLLSAYLYLTRGKVLPANSVARSLGKQFIKESIRETFS